MYECGYCGGSVVWNDERYVYVHATDGNRIAAVDITPGDWMSARHNRAGTRVNPADLLVVPVDYDRMPDE